MISFDAAHQAVHHPQDRRFRLWLNRPALILLVILVLGPLALAWFQRAMFGLPQIAPTPAAIEGVPSGPHGFPFWIRWSDFCNMFFLFMLIRSGLSILMEDKRIEHIEFVESEKLLGEGEGGINEDDEYFDLLTNI